MRQRDMDHLEFLVLLDCLSAVPGQRLMDDVVYRVAIGGAELVSDLLVRAPLRRQLDRACVPGSSYGPVAVPSQ